MPEKNNQNAPTQAQLQALIQFASKRLGMTPEAFAKTIQNGDVSGLTANMKPEEAAKLNAVVSDKSTAEQVVQSPEAQKLIQQLLNNSKKK